MPRDNINWRERKDILCKSGTDVNTSTVNAGSSPAVNTKKNIKNNENYLEVSKIFVIFVL